jgi:4-aminobutyrate aminotransferase-like enzyme/Ser/Thr protein kinase RdoA (MazF antagonist)
MSQDFTPDKLLETPAPRFSVEEVTGIAEKLYSLSGKLSALGSERDQNFHLVTSAGDQYVIKISNSAEDQDIIDLQVKALEHITQVSPELPVPKVLLSRSGNPIEEISARDGRSHSVRVVSYIPGVPPKEDAIGTDFYRQLGRCLARISRALASFFHPKANYELLWDLKHTPKLRDYLNFINDAHQLELAIHFLDRFDRNVLHQLPGMRAQIVHNDLVPDNVLVSEEDPNQIIGVIDFGDLVHTHLVVDLATSIAATLRETDQPAVVAAQIVSGFNELIPLEAAELEVLYDLVGARLVMLNIIANWRVTLHPENRDYIMGGVDQTWRILKLWRDQDPMTVTKKFFRACGLWELEDPEGDEKEPEPLESLLLRRADLLGPHAYLFYKEPLHIVRGEGVWLFDIDNKRYLDAYNNVPQVGHCHPHVVKAISRQARSLNTSTRYLNDHILELAERITDRLPEPLSVCTFVCTGSEANELAWRMAKLASGNKGALITSYSYHGSTDAVVQFSTENLPDRKPPPHVKTFSAPSSDQTWDEPDAGIGAAINELADSEYSPAMLIVDTTFVSDGIYTSPKGYLKTLFDATQAAGGLCVADEVQGGFGRLGSHFWGFEFDNVLPDIVTMGKPMGNGHPLAGLVTTPEIADALAREAGYFNTFGGNPVSCAAGLAVLEVIEKEGLEKNALDVGNYLMTEINSLNSKDPRLGQIHGSGLLLGIDILNPDGKPDSQLADKIMNYMRQKGVLIGTTGLEGNVLKIRPPLVFTEEHAGILLEVLRNALDEL